VLGTAAAAAAAGRGLEDSLKDGAEQLQQQIMHVSRCSWVQEEGINKQLISDNSMDRLEKQDVQGGPAKVKDVALIARFKGSSCMETTKHTGKPLRSRHGRVPEVYLRAWSYDSVCRNQFGSHALELIWDPQGAVSRKPQTLLLNLSDKKLGQHRVGSGPASDVAAAVFSSLVGCSQHAQHHE
jgi:hypothetical protein